jgi:choline transport protein
MGEEVHNATVIVPRSMMWCIVVNGVVGLAMYCAILFCAGDLDAALTSRFIYPFIEVIEQALNSTTGTALVLVIILLVDLGLVVGVVAASSRMLWSFARDRGVPGWRRLSQVRYPPFSSAYGVMFMSLTFLQVNTKTSIPTAAIITSAIISLLIGLITIGSPVAFNDVISLTVGSLYASYFSACAFLLYRRVQGAIKDPSMIDYEARKNLPGAAGNLVWGP